jgi:hypothetical protein
MSDVPARGGASYHAVQFYSNESCLYSTVATFVGEGFLSGEPAILIATEPHAKGIIDALTTRFIDVAAASRMGELTVLDAAATLSALTKHRGPDRQLVEQQLGVLIDRTRAGRKRARVRIYGEMVDLLWKAGEADAALSLEKTWNDLASRYAFSLLCGYSVGNFYKQATQFPDICAEHTHVLGADSQASRVEPRRLMTPD